MRAEQGQWTPGELPGELQEALTESKAQLEELKSLSEDLRVRQERLSELLAPSEAALKARTEYLDRVLREQLRGAEQSVTRLVDELRQANENARRQLLESAEALIESERQRTAAGRKVARARLVWSVAALFMGGALAGFGASWASRPAEATSAQGVVERAEASVPALAKKPRPKPRASGAPVSESGS